ncbi:adenosylcobinamide-phosphate synthase [Roseibium hamelinense]|uniref:Cobalamin biosynthesis protein CobD n=1 Tax=Roseibium hamelinense TaxID=150831 RepID=A0A562TGP6_9HYPH|nr:adenosylcobinamide-phosphate synthase CbiB [Roseibium hamelinense]MTI46038.1 cobalamin biosynthesis protein [Roseibium hamelinense]TWI92771.1 adenosylcobinamide-phosphate synthase [Roseibium hamelinense]
MLLYDTTLWLLLAALLVDAVVGDPDWLWRRLPHPVALIGKVISTFDHGFNRSHSTAQKRRFAGVLLLVILVFGGLLVGAVLQLIASLLPHGGVLTVIIGAVFIAQNSLFAHVAAVRRGLLQDGLAGGRQAVAMIVGRDPKQLDEAGVSRAAIESCAENFSDGVVAPVFWFALLGLPGLIAYKAVNTADSMIGHKNEKYAEFGWASARFDDLINLPASRLSAIFIALAAPFAGGSPFKSLWTVARDARKHRSPNAGWPEAATAGALNLALAGPRIYSGYTVDDPYMNENGRRDATARDISRSLTLLCGACVFQALAVLWAAYTFQPL